MRFNSLNRYFNLNNPKNLPCFGNRIKGKKEPHTQRDRKSKNLRRVAFGVSILFILRIIEIIGMRGMKQHCHMIMEYFLSIFL